MDDLCITACHLLKNDIQISVKNQKIGNKNQQNFNTAIQIDFVDFVKRTILKYCNDLTKLYEIVKF